MSEGDKGSTDSSDEVWTILGIDPGGTTGYAFLRYDPLEVVKEIRIKWIELGEVKSADFNVWLRRNIGLCSHVALEDFVIRPQVSSWRNTTQVANNLLTAKLVGRVELACDWQGKVLHKYEPKEKEFFYSLNGMEYQKGKKNMHKYDAMAHARGLLRRERGV